MKDSILNFNKQFDFAPEIENQEKIKDFDHVILCGMGGSHLSADLIKTIKPGVDLYVHKDYNLPPYEDDFLKRALLIACSYSGNTEETISFLKDAYAKNLNIASITTGGKILEFSLEKEIPFIKIENTNIQPRQADGFISISILKLMGDEDMIASLSLLSDRLNPKELEEQGTEIAEKIGDLIPVVYASNRNLHLTYNWKITFNETAKIPAFYNVFPELNHNEMQGFENRANNFCIIFLEDEDDAEEIKKRMSITKDLFDKKGLFNISIDLKGGSRQEKVFNSVILADWVALKLAEFNDVDPEKVPTIEEFKNKMTSH